MLLGFFGLLCFNEFTVPSYDSAAHLSYSDIAVDDQDNPSVVVIYIKNQRASITLGCSLHSESTNALPSEEGFMTRYPVYMQK